MEPLPILPNGVIETAGDLFGATALTPERIQAAVEHAQLSRERAAETRQHDIELTRFLDAREQGRDQKQQEQEREATRQRQRESERER